MNIEVIRQKINAALKKFASFQEGDVTVNASGDGKSVIIEIADTLKPPYDFILNVLSHLWGGSKPHNYQFTITNASDIRFLESLPENFFEDLYREEQRIKFTSSSTKVACAPQVINDLDSNNAKTFSSCITPHQHLVTGTVGNLYIPHSDNPSDKEKIDDVGGAYYLKDGLPAIYMADGAYGTNPAFADYLCNTFLPTILQKYADCLSVGEDPQVVMKHLLIAVNNEANACCEHFRLEGQDAPRCTFSCAITYKNSKTGTQCVASIGVGSDILMVYKKPQSRGQSSGGYLPLRSAESFFQANPIFDNGTKVKGQYDHSSIEHIVNQNQGSLPGVKVFLPVTSERLFTKEVPANVTVIDSLNPGDQLVALSDGAYEFLPQARNSTHMSDSPEDPGYIITTDFDVNMVSGQWGFLPHELFNENRIRHSKKLGQGDDALVVSAVIPSLDVQEQLSNKEKEDLNSYKKRVIQVLETEYPWRPRMFGHHHHGRRVAICEAIRDAKSALEVAIILKNQFEKLDPGKQNKEMPIRANLLPELYGLRIKNKPGVGKQSGLRSAIELALKVK